VPIYEDIFDLTGKEVIGHGNGWKTIDLIHGGFPCQ
jgi:site-specific DNA-cytosine methylase